ncbi:pentapeptide repeat-containing protein [Nostoc sp. LEGE 12450]|uniref:pentapeptide repeat-containing protein n=1 Tax=Nostoc sp. LEGE 12450 TaxID=1828643 RepID=UPI00187F173E|nr:pentapeptide repeat-containing protein [Nostoc sp. LEGE 12450]MBE8991994.1 pentapeptide repeat-containing protein [Nostoc sp. LEGE 12450]
MFQDFSYQNLRGRSFKGENLVGANFSSADIRGADFSSANLRGADFRHAQAGLQGQWAIFLVLVSCLLSGISGFIWYLNGYLLLLIFEGSLLSNQFLGWTTLILLIVFFFTTIRQGVGAGLGIFAIAVAIAASVIIFLGDTVGAGTVAGVFAGSGFGALISAVAVVGAGALAFTIAFITAFAIAGVLAGANAFVIVVALAGLLISIYISSQAMKEDEKYSWVRNLAIILAATGGTSFRGANLTNTDFTAAVLKSTDFRNAILTNTRWHQVKMLDRVRPGLSYLQNLQIRQLLTTGQGQEKNFDRKNLRGVNLKGSNLADASFIGTDLSEANLQDTDLSRAKLKQTQLDGTDFTGATLTGAYIEDWGITTDTNFDGVKCEYVYMRLPTKENPDPHRKPDNRQEVFADGEFGDFIKPIFDTLDLYHNQGVDPRAIAISFKHLAENNPEADLRIVGMEVRGEDKFLLRAKTAIAADKSQLSAEYFATYNQLKALAEQEVKALIAEKDGRIADLQNMVVTALQRPSFYSNVEQVGFMTNNPGGFSVGGSVGGNVNNVQGDNNRAVQGDNNQAVLGDGNQVTQHNQVGADTGESLTKEDVVKLLSELENLIQGAELPTDTKQEVVEDLSAAKKATDKEEPNKQRALDRLTGVAETLEKTSKSVEAGKKIWTTAKPIIVKVAAWLGAAAGSHLLGL